MNVAGSRHGEMILLIPLALAVGNWKLEGVLPQSGVQT